MGSIRYVRGIVGGIGLTGSVPIQPSKINLRGWDRVHKNCYLLGALF